MMCISLPTSDIYNLVGMMSIIQAQIYYSNIVVPNTNITSFLNEVILNDMSTGKYEFSIQGTTWTYLSKSQFSGLDLWDNVVAYNYQQGLNVQSWGRPYMPSLCPPNIKYPVLNISGLSIGNLTWKGTQDHSKWGIPFTTNVVCYGDMNRMTSQRTRGGGALCINNPILFNLHNAIITKVDPCT